jgi:hypothetical protein
MSKWARKVSWAWHAICRAAKHGIRDRVEHNGHAWSPRTPPSISAEWVARRWPHDVRMSSGPSLLVAHGQRATVVHSWLVGPSHQCIQSHRVRDWPARPTCWCPTPAQWRWAARWFWLLGRIEAGGPSGFSFSFMFLFHFLFLNPNLNFNLDSNFCGPSVTNFICALKVLSLRIFI